MWRSAAGALLILIVMAPGALAQEKPMPPAQTTSPVRGVPGLRAIVGVWTSDADPGGAINITAAGSSSVSVNSNRGYEAIGYLRGLEFTGLTRDPSGDKAPDGPFAYGIVQIHFTDKGTATAEFSPALGKPATRSETWRLSGRFGQRADTPPPRVVVREPDRIVVREPGSNDAPKLGEYVYVEELPEAIERVPPHYPDSAREQKISGTVMVQALVGKDGGVKQTVIVKSIPELDEAAMTAVRQWRFKPAMAKGAPVAVWVAVPVKFSLH